MSKLTRECPSLTPHAIERSTIIIDTLIFQPFRVMQSCSIEIKTGFMKTVLKTGSRVFYLFIFFAFAMAAACKSYLKCRELFAVDFI